MDMIDRMLAHDAWTTRRLLDVCRDAPGVDMHAGFDMGLGTVHATFAHIIGAMDHWAQRLDDRAPAHDDAPASERWDTVEKLRGALDSVEADLASVARSMRDTGRLDEPMSFSVDGHTYRFTRGTAILHVATHGMHHRAQILNMLRSQGIEHDVDGDAIDWELAVAPAP